MPVYYGTGQLAKERPILSRVWFTVLDAAGAPVPGGTLTINLTRNGDVAPVAIVTAGVPLAGVVITEVPAASGKWILTMRVADLSITGPCLLEVAHSGTGEDFDLYEFVNSDTGRNV